MQRYVPFCCIKNWKHHFLPFPISHRYALLSILFYKRLSQISTDSVHSVQSNWRYAPIYSHGVIDIFCGNLNCLISLNLWLYFLHLILVVIACYEWFLQQDCSTIWITQTFFNLIKEGILSLLTHSIFQVNNLAFAKGKQVGKLTLLLGEKGVGIYRISCGVFTLNTVIKARSMNYRTHSSLGISRRHRFDSWVIGC